MTRGLVLVANPGSASRKYALFDGSNERAKLHFEIQDERIIGTLHRNGKASPIPITITELSNATDIIIDLFRDNDVIQSHENLAMIGIRVVAPGSYFLSDHIVDPEFIEKLEDARRLAPLHIDATMAEIQKLRQSLPSIPIKGVSDSSFHRTKPDHTWNYGIDLDFSDQYEIKRFGYHGLSVASVIKQTPLPDKNIVCHLGSGVSITATRQNRSVDTTMGFSPLEGLIMGTRSGSIDITAAMAIKRLKGFDDQEMESYLNTQSGLLGLGGSSDIRELLAREQQGEHRAHLTLDTYCYAIAKSIAAMTVALGGSDGLIFTGAVGERSAAIRERITSYVNYLGFTIDSDVNVKIDTTLSKISMKQSKLIYVIPTKEESEIAKHAMEI